ncbi:MAG: hypothetical protein AAF333_17100 [Planctomycetota bacterium]
MPEASEPSAAATVACPPRLDDVLALPELRVFKQDRRTRVWLIEGGHGQRWVIKRFDHAPLRQTLTAALGRHPVQREVLWHGRLIDAGLAVVPAFDLGADDAGRRHQATPYRGPTLYDLLRENPPPAAKARHDLTRQAGRLTGQLLALRVFYRDLKASNLVVDDNGTLYLIDAGDCRGAKGTPLLATALRMLARLNQHTQRAGPGYSFTPVHRSDRLRFLGAMFAAWPTPPDGLQHLPRHPDFLTKH